MAKLYIKEIRFLSENCPSKRQLKITLSNGTVVRARAWFESWEQWGGTVDELWITESTTNRYDEWLHGGERNEEV